MRTKFYDIRRTDAYIDAFGVYSLLPENYKYRIENLISKEVYAAILFSKYVLRSVDDYCCKFFECKEHGFSYEIGCYLQKREYVYKGMISSDINKFSSLLSIYDKDRYPEESRLVEEFVHNLESFLKKWEDFEEGWPCLFEKEE